MVKQAALVGRDKELAHLNGLLAAAASGKGAATIILGEPGVGKTRMLTDFIGQARAAGVNILAGAASSSSAQPFHVFSKALEGIEHPLLWEAQEQASFAGIFAVDNAGLLLAKASTKEGSMEPNAFAGMLSAVQEFIRDSFDRSREKNAGLGRLEYGDMKILIEHGEYLFITALIKGSEHTDMKTALRHTLQSIERKCEAIIETATGNNAEVEIIREEIAKLANIDFLVRVDLDGVKLENERLRIADRILTCLIKISSEKPLVLILEDLHWSDASSLFVLTYLARNIRNNRILMLGTGRLNESDTLQKVIENMKIEGTLTELSLERLDVLNTITLINEIFAPNDFPDTLADRIYEQSKGNPLFVTEMLRGMHNDGSISESEGKYHLASESYRIPSTVEEVVNRRLDALGPDAMALVEYISCIGQRFGPSIATSNRICTHPEASLEKLLSSGILLKMDGNMEFSHAVFQSVIYSSIGPRWKAQHHKTIGEYLENSNPDSIDEVVYELARHFSKCNEYQKCVRYCIKAGEKAESLFAVEQALDYYKDVLKALSKLGAASSKDVAGDITERIGDIQKMIGDYDDAIGSYMAAGNIASTVEVKARMLRKSGEVHEKKGELDSSLEFLEMARQTLGDAFPQELGRIIEGEGLAYWRKGEHDTALKSVLQALSLLGEAGGNVQDNVNALRMAGNIHHSKGDTDRALDYFMRSLALAEKAHYLYGISGALNNIGLLFDDRGDAEKALEYYKRGLEIHEKIGDRQGIALSLINIGVVLHGRDKLDEALEYYRRGCEIQERIGERWAVSGSLNNIGVAHHDKGDLDKALEYYRRSLGMRESIGNKQGIAASLNNIGTVNHDKGDLDMALEYYRRSLEMRESIGNKQGIARALNNVGTVLHDKGDVGKALEFLNRSLDMREKVGDRPGMAITLYHIGNAHDAMGDADLALEAYRRSLDICLETGDRKTTIYDYNGLAETHLALGESQAALEYAEKAMCVALETEAKSLEGECHRVLGMVYRDKMDWDRATVEYGKSQALLDKAGSRKELARLFYELGILYKASSKTIKATEYLNKALAEFEDMGMLLWAEKSGSALKGP